MTDETTKGLKRRDFILSASGGLFGLTVAGEAWSATPCPPPSISVDGGTSSSTPCTMPGQLPSLSLTSAAASGTYGWTVGHAFRKGDVPQGMSVTGNANSFQCDIRNRWSDGSVKFAVLSGISAFSQGAPKAVALSNASGGGGQNVAEPTTLDASITFSGGVTGTYTLQSCLGVDRSSWNRSQPGRVRSIPGPAMSEFHYFRPTSDAHVTVWFYVRCYSNGNIEIETVVENGWIGVGSPGQRDYSVNLAVGGSTRYSASLNHFHHTRWSRIDWVGVDPKVTPKHDVAYLRSTRMVPNYGYTSPSSGAFSGLPTAVNPAPFALGNWSPTMGATGAQDAIGLLPKWEALYCSSGDSRAYVATVSNHRGSGRWPIHYRDENTGRVALYSAYPTTTLSSGWGSAPPSAGGGSVGPWDIPHHPSNGYLAYLLDGRWPALESQQFSAMTAILESNPDTRRGGGVVACLNAPLTTRGVAWAWRTVGQAAAISPTALAGGAIGSSDAALQIGFAASVSNTASWAKQRYIDGSIDGGAHKNSIGWLGQYDQYSGAAGEFWGGSWMVQFQSLALGHISDLEIEGLASPANLAAVRNHSYENCLQQLGDDSNWNFRRGAVYDRPYLNNGSNPNAPSFMTQAQAFASYRATRGLSALSATSGNTLKAHSSDSDMTSGDSSNDANGFWAVALSVLSFAVDHGRPGASAKRALVTAASNYNPSSHGASDNPTWAIVPR